MGSQWAGMVEGFLQLEPFAKAINRAATILQAEGIDLLSILNSKDEKTFDNLLNSAVSITCMQVIFWYLYSYKLIDFKLNITRLGGIYRFIEIDWN